MIGRGGSAILDPDGTYLAGPLYDEEGILYADLDPARLWEERQRFDPAGHYHRPDVLSLTVTPQADVSTATVVGAGVSGASIARALALRGWDVTLVEQYSPGTVRSASGGDTRLLRMAHGPVEWYTRSAWEARSGWIELQERTGTRIWEPVGVAWFAHGDGGFEAQSQRAAHPRSASPSSGSRPTRRAASTPTLARRRPRAVSLRARGGRPPRAARDPAARRRGARRGARLDAGRVLPADAPRADAVVWACGAWLPALFPAHVEVRISRRDVFFFGADGVLARHAGLLRLRRRLLRPRRARRPRGQGRARTPTAPRSTRTRSSGSPTPSASTTRAPTRPTGSRVSPARRSSARASASTT